MQPFLQIFPDSQEGVACLQLLKKTGRIPKGDYLFIEAYCTDKGCDCRRVTLFVVNGKGKPMTAIDFGLDPDSPMAGPFIADYLGKESVADDILELFTDRINQDAQWLEGMHERYRKVRQHVDGRKYRGKPFPKPGSVIRVSTAPPDVAGALEELLELPRGKGVGPSQMSLFAESQADASASRQSMAAIVDQLTRLEKRGLAAMDEHDHLIRTVMLPDLGRYDELAALLPRLIPRNSREEERMQAALQLLRGLLEMLRHEIEAGRPKSRERLEALQQALARHVFGEKGDHELASHITRILLDTRVEILPVVREANQQRMMAIGGEGGPVSPAFKGPSLGTLLRKAGCESPFEGIELLLDMMLLLDAEIQITLCHELLDSRDSFVRETAALMLFHPQREVREGVAALLASGRVRPISPETLRRLIISRNWFPAAMRGQIDAAITTARRGKVVCAQLAPPVDCMIRASAIDGAGAQSFFITAGTKKRKLLCNILWKQGQGVIDSFVVFPSQKELTALLNDMPESIVLQEVAPACMDRTVCHALAAGNEGGKPPHLGLLQVAEALGCDRWKADGLIPEKELALIRREMEGNAPHLLGRGEQREALQESALWPEFESFAETWFEDDIAVDEAIRNAQKGKKKINHDKLAGVITREILELRRPLWLERVVLMTLWLRESTQSSVPWQHMFHVAEALAGGKPLKDIPLMVSIAEVSLAAALERGALQG